MRVLVTGSAGFIGQRVMALLERSGHTAVPFDHPDDVLDPQCLQRVQVDAAIHLAADKHAPHGEDDPEQITLLNVVGTANVVRAVPKVILASTCKAAAPITCYGASKLIAERIVLNVGGTVMRLVNVEGSSGSVTEIWDNVPAEDPLPVVDATRMFVKPDQAAELLVRALSMKPGRYAPIPRQALSMAALATVRHPHREIRVVPLRKGDRPVERIANDYETTIPVAGDMVRIVDCWEPVEALTEAA